MENYWPCSCEQAVYTTATLASAFHGWDGQIWAKRYYRFQYDVKTFCGSAKSHGVQTFQYSVSVVDGRSVTQGEVLHRTQEVSVWVLL